MLLKISTLNWINFAVPVEIHKTRDLVTLLLYKSRTSLWKRKFVLTEIYHTTHISAPGGKSQLRQLT